MYYSVVRFLRSEDATTAVEYAVMLAMVLMAVLSTIGAIGAQQGGMWLGIQSQLRTYGFVK